MTGWRGRVAYRRYRAISLRRLGRRPWIPTASAGHPPMPFLKSTESTIVSISATIRRQCARISKRARPLSASQMFGGALKPRSLRLTAERLIAASRCKHQTYAHEKRISPEFGGGFGGTLEEHNLKMAAKLKFAELWRSHVRLSSRHLNSAFILQRVRVPDRGRQRCSRSPNSPIERRL